MKKFLLMALIATALLITGCKPTPPSNVKKLRKEFTESLKPDFTYNGGNGIGISGTAYLNTIEHVLLRDSLYIESLTEDRARAYVFSTSLNLINDHVEELMNIPFKTVR